MGKERKESKMDGRSKGGGREGGKKRGLVRWVNWATFSKASRECQGHLSAPFPLADSFDPSAVEAVPPRPLCVFPQSQLMRPPPHRLALLKGRGYVLPTHLHELLSIICKQLSDIWLCKYCSLGLVWPWRQGTSGVRPGCREKGCLCTG